MLGWLRNAQPYLQCILFYFIIFLNLLLAPLLGVILHALCNIYKYNVKSKLH